ncbi:hypothetical protein J2S51_006665 [Streptomyces sp. DSM 41269]|nr:hypothetical protein [Streptomyces sp. DSM 41269]
MTATRSNHDRPGRAGRSAAGPPGPGRGRDRLRAAPPERTLSSANAAGRPVSGLLQSLT